jgi:hypothetical protein
MLRKLLNGRPMKLEGPAFRDFIGNEQVNYYIDRCNRRWMATNHWGWFRVLSSKQGA